VSSGCLSSGKKVTGSASAHGPGNPPVVTVSTAPPVGTTTGTGECAFELTPVGITTVTIIASAPGYQSVSVTLGVGGHVNSRSVSFKNHVAEYGHELTAITTKWIPLNIVPEVTFTVTKADGEIADCCDSGTLIKDGYKHAAVEGEVKIKGTIKTPLSYVISYKSDKVLGGQVSGDVEFGIIPAVNINFNMAGEYKSPACNQKTCLNLSGTVTGGMTGSATASFKLEFDYNQKKYVLDGGVTPVALSATAKGNLSYVGCPPGTGLQGYACVGPVKLIMDPSVSLKTPIPGLNLKGNVFGLPTKQWELFPGNCPQTKE
ncbi:MAG: hypothetical protein M3Y56_02055, partial [Armatimonadota bacterium]|nr:hypothetical protein [Armatimonadota bacterium]